MKTHVFDNFKVLSQVQMSFYCAFKVFLEKPGEAVCVSLPESPEPLGSVLAARVRITPYRRPHSSPPHLGHNTQQLSTQAGKSPIFSRFTERSRHARDCYQGEHSWTRPPWPHSLLERQTLNSVMGMITMRQGPCSSRPGTDQPYDYRQTL